MNNQTLEIELKARNGIYWRTNVYWLVGIIFTLIWELVFRLIFLSTNACVWCCSPQPPNKVAISSFHQRAWSYFMYPEAATLSVPTRPIIYTTILPESSHGQSAENSIWPALHFPAYMLTQYECWLITCTFKTQPHQICFAYVVAAENQLIWFLYIRAGLPVIRVK